MTDLDLDQLEAAAKAATPGNWTRVYGSWNKWAGAIEIRAARIRGEVDGHSHGTREDARIGGEVDGR